MKFEKTIIDHRDYLPDGVTFDNLEKQIKESEGKVLDAKTLEELYGNVLVDFDIDDYPEVLDYLRKKLPNNNISIHNNRLYAENLTEKDTFTILEALRKLRKK